LKIVFADMRKGVVKLKTENADDLWYLYQIIRPMDYVHGTAERAVKKEEYQKAERRKISVKILVSKTEFKGSVLRVLGKMEEGPEDVGKGHQSLNITEGDEVKIEKKWGEYDKKVLEESQTKVEPVFLSVIEDGEMDFAILGKKMEFLGSLKRNLPPKSKPEFESILDSFYKETAKLIEERSKPFKKTIIGGHRFCLENLRRFLKKEAFFGDVSTVGKTGLNEIIKRGYVERVMEKDRLSKESDAVEKLLLEISKNGKYAYGTKEVREAKDMNAIEKLLVTDGKIKESRMEDIKEIEEIMRNVSSKKGDVMIIKSSEEPGEKLDGLGGIGALLRFRIK
jgi:protein pelota